MLLEVKSSFNASFIVNTYSTLISSSDNIQCLVTTVALYSTSYVLGVVHTVFTVTRSVLRGSITLSANQQSFVNQLGNFCPSPTTMTTTIVNTSGLPFFLPATPKPSPTIAAAATSTSPPLNVTIDLSSSQVLTSDTESKIGASIGIPLRAGIGIPLAAIIILLLACIILRQKLSRRGNTRSAKRSRRQVPWSWIPWLQFKDELDAQEQARNELAARKLQKELDAEAQRRNGLHTRERSGELEGVLAYELPTVEMEQRGTCGKVRES